MASPYFCESKLDLAVPFCMYIVKNVSNSMIFCCGKLLDPMRGVLDVVRQARALVFDFDGTLVDSISIKGRAFEVCFAEFRDRRSEILAYCRGHNHLTRGEKFQYVYQQILGLPYTEEIATVLHRRFAAVTTDAIIAAPEIPGATRFLGWTARSHSKALLSSTPHGILMDILLCRGWRDYFTTIQGAPVLKAGWLQAYREAHKLEQHEIVFFGDTVEDAHAAKDAGCTFVAVANDALMAESPHQVTDFTELLLT